jgi:uncharacterized OB-fold protein
VVEVVRVQVCRRCGRINLPFKYRCKCGSREFDYIEMNIEGTLVATTKIFVTPKGYPSPLLVGLVDAGDLKLLVRLEEEAPVGNVIEVVQADGGVLIGRPKKPVTDGS